MLTECLPGNTLLSPNDPTDLPMFQPNVRKPEDKRVISYKLEHRAFQQLNMKSTLIRSNLDMTCKVCRPHTI